MEREEVLAWAGAARTRRDEVVAGVASGGLPLEDVLMGRHDPLVGAIKLVVVVQAAPPVGKVRARRVLASIGLEDRRLADLDDGEVTALLAALNAGGE